MRNAFTHTAVALALVLATSVTAAAQNAGRWLLTTTAGGELQMELQWPDDTEWRRTVTLAEFQGLPENAVAAAAAMPVSFRIEQDAGRFDFTGSASAGGGRGEFRFAPNRPFVATLRSLGVAEVPEVTDHELKNLAWGGMSARAIRDFLALGFDPLTFGEVIELAVQQVSPGYVRSLRALGVRETHGVRDAVQARMFGVTPELVRELAAVGVRDLTGRELVGLRMSGVSLGFVRYLREAGHRDLSQESLRALASRAREAARAAARQRG